MADFLFLFGGGGGGPEDGRLLGERKRRRDRIKYGEVELISER